MIALSDCRENVCYRLRSRNLELGVFNGRGGFIGIRTKFGSRYLFTEFHQESSATHGTVSPLTEVATLPAGILASESLGTVDETTRRAVEFDRPRLEGGRGWYYRDTGEADDDISPVRLDNDALFAWLDAQEAALTHTSCERCDGSGLRERAEDGAPCWVCGGTGRGPLAG